MAASWPFCLATGSFWQLWILLSYSQGNEWHSVGRIAKWILEVEESTLVFELRECNLVWNHTCNFKIYQVHSMSSIWNHKNEFRPKLQDTKFNYIFVISILKTQNSIPQLQDILLSSTELVFWKFAKVFFHSPLIWLGTINKPWNLIGCCVLLKASQWPGKRCDLEQKWFDSWINYTDESQWDCKDHQLFQNERNNTLVSSISRYFFSLMVQHLWSNFLKEKKIEKIRKWSVFGKT